MTVDMIGATDNGFSRAQRRPFSCAATSRAQDRRTHPERHDKCMALSCQRVETPVGGAGTTASLNADGNSGFSSSLKEDDRW